MWKIILRIYVCTLEQSIREEVNTYSQMPIKTLKLVKCGRANAENLLVDVVIHIH